MACPDLPHRKIADGKENSDANKPRGGRGGCSEQQRASSIELLARLLHLAEVALYVCACM
jgi:hypothetical protein